MLRRNGPSPLHPDAVGHCVNTCRPALHNQTQPVSEGNLEDNEYCSAAPLPARLHPIYARLGLAANRRGKHAASLRMVRLFQGLNNCFSRSSSPASSALAAAFSRPLASAILPSRRWTFGGRRDQSAPLRFLPGTSGEVEASCATARDFDFPCQSKHVWGSLTKRTAAVHIHATFSRHYL